MISFLRNITPLQWLGIVILANGTIIGGTNYLAELFTSGQVKVIVAVASLGNMFIGGLVTMLSGQGAQIKNVLAMPGVENISVGRQANATLAAIAMDPDQNKIAPTQDAQRAVTATASAG